MTIGATWDPALAADESTRPSVYINFASEPVPAPIITADGRLLYIGPANWGPLTTVASIKSAIDVAKYIGSSSTDTVRRGILGALAQGASEVLFYRIATGSAAKATLVLNDGAGSPLPAITVTAKYEGTRGNALKAEVILDLVDSNIIHLNIYEGTAKLETFSGTDNDSIVADYTAKGSNYVVLTVTGTANRDPAAITATSLTGGVSGEVVDATDFTDALDAVSSAVFRVVTVATTDSAILASVSAWVGTQRAGGNRVRAVLAAPSADVFADLLTDAASFNNEGVSYLVTGFEGSDGVTRLPVEAALTVGAIAAVQDTNSITHHVIPGATNVHRRFDASEYAAGLKGGLLILTFDGQKVFIEQGLNTLQVASQVAPKSRDWRKIRYVAIQDELVDRIGRRLADEFIGKVPNDSRGRAEAVTMCKAELDGMMRDRLLVRGIDENGDDVTANAFLDPRYLSTADRIYIAITGKEIDAVEAFFLTAVI